ncbi:hypothetical protein LBMAG52_15970 [Planctomycetia bacterium]|nr:hypothetical protein LBMAG52_15970 [Planctomycetia bacterium]
MSGSAPKAKDPPSAINNANSGKGFIEFSNEWHSWTGFIQNSADRAIRHGAEDS